ncbi:mechanosensitive ion channel family protein [Oceanithermus sp.]
MTQVWSYVSRALESLTGAGGASGTGLAERGAQLLALVLLAAAAWVVAWVCKRLTGLLAAKLEPAARRRLLGVWDVAFWGATLTFASSVFSLGDPRRVVAATLRLMLAYLVWVAVEAFIELRLARRGVDRNLVILSRYAAITLIIVWAAYMVAGAEIAPVVGALGILGLAVSLAAQDTFSNFIAGIILLMDRPFRIGDWVKVGEEFGQVEGLTLRTTRLRTPDNESVAIPNAVVAGGEIKNLSAGGPLRLRIPVGVAYRHDTAEAKEALWPVVRRHPRVLAEPEPALLVTALGDSSVEITLVVWIAQEDIPDYPVITAEILEAAKAALDAAGIEIPFPQQTVWFPQPLRVVQESPE